AGLLIGAPVLGTMLVAAARDRLAGKRSLRQAMRHLLAIILYVGAAIVTAQGLPLGEAPPNLLVDLAAPGFVLGLGISFVCADDPPQRYAVSRSLVGWISFALPTLAVATVAIFPYTLLPTESDTAALSAQAIALQLCCAFSFAAVALGLSVVSLGG